MFNNKTNERTCLSLIFALIFGCSLSLSRPRRTSHASYIDRIIDRALPIDSCCYCLRATHFALRAKMIHKFCWLVVTKCGNQNNQWHTNVEKLFLEIDIHVFQFQPPFQTRWNDNRKNERESGKTERERERERRTLTYLHVHIHSHYTMCICVLFTIKLRWLWDGNQRLFVVRFKSRLDSRTIERLRRRRRRRERRSTVNEQLAQARAGEYLSKYWKCGIQNRSLALHKESS